MANVEIKKGNVITMGFTLDTPEQAIALTEAYRSIAVGGASTDEAAPEPKARKPRAKKVEEDELDEDEEDLEQDEEDEELDEDSEDESDDEEEDEEDSEEDEDLKEEMVADLKGAYNEYIKRHGGKNEKAKEKAFKDAQGILKECGIKKVSEVTEKQFKAAMKKLSK